MSNNGTSGAATPSTMQYAAFGDSCAPDNTCVCMLLHCKGTVEVFTDEVILCLELSKGAQCVNHHVISNEQDSH